MIDSSRRKLAWSALWLASLWAVLLLRGFPFPCPDDGFYLGAGFSISEGGPLRNPLFENAGPFYVYPPLYSYFVGLCFWIFGVSATSIIVVHVFLCWASTWLVLRTCQIVGEGLLGWLLVVSLVIYFTCVGLRADVLGFCLVALSVRLGFCQSHTGRAFSPLFAALSISTLPAEAAIAIPWTLYLLFSRRVSWLACVMAGVGVALLNAVALGGHLAEFWSVFSHHAAEARATHFPWYLDNWYRPQGVVKIWFPIVSIVTLLILTVRKRGLRLEDPLILLSLILGVYGMIHSVSGQRILPLITLACIAYYLRELAIGLRWKTAITGACTGLIVIFGIRHLAQGVTTQKPAGISGIIQAIDAIHPSRLIVDEWSLRYVFNYQLRPEMIFLAYGDRPFSGAIRTPRKYPDECWVISAESVNYLKLKENGLPAPRRFGLFGISLGEWITNAGELALLPPEHDKDPSPSTE